MSQQRITRLRQSWRQRYKGALFVILASVALRAQTLPGPANWAATAPDGRNWVVGTTIARDLPTTPGVLQPRPGWDKCEGEGERDCQDLFIARVSPGGQVEKLTYLGGAGDEWSDKITLSSDGRALYLIVGTNSERILGRDLAEGEYTIAIGLTADLDRALFVTPLPVDLPSYSPAFAPDGIVWSVEESNFQQDNHLVSFDPVTAKLTRIQSLTPEPGRRIGSQFTYLAPDGDIYVQLVHFALVDGEFETTWTLSRYTRDGRTEVYRRVVPGLVGVPVAGGIFWFSTSDPLSQLGRISPDGAVEYFATLTHAFAPYRFVPRGANELWFAGSTGQALRTTSNAPRHCRVKAREGYLGRVLLGERRIDYLAFAGRDEPADALFLEPQANGLRFIAATPTATRVETLTIGQAGPAPFCLDANPDGLVRAGAPRGPFDSFCSGPCRIDFTDPSLLAPGQMIALPGRGLGPVTESKAAPGPLPRNLAGTRLLLDGNPLALLAVREDRIDAVLPYTLTPGSTPKFTVERNSATTGNTTVKIVESNPEAFAGPKGGRAFRPDGTEVAENDLVHPGDRLTVYLSGAGRWLQDDVDESRPVDRTLRPALAIRAVVSRYFSDREEATVEYAGQVTGLLPGILQVNLRLPPTLAGGPTRVVIYCGESGFALIWLTAAPPVPEPE